MCLAIPGKIISINENEEDVFRKGRVSFDGVVQEVNLSLVPEAMVGHYVLVHVGLALNVVDEEEAEKALQYFRELGDMEGELGLGTNDND